MYDRHVRSVAGSCLDKLHPLCKTAVFDRYDAGKTTRQIAAENGVSSAYIQQRYSEGIRKLKRDKHIRRLEEYTQRSAYKGSGLSAFRNRAFTSSVEMAVLHADMLLRAYAEK